MAIEVRRVTTLIAGAIVAGTAYGQADCRAASGAGTGVLLELFTSEGCSSCPPAERWLGRIAREDVRAGRVVPIAFHVTYWDYLGWKDPFAKPAFVDRQKEVRNRQSLRALYTPQVVLAGRDFPDWHRVAIDTAIRTAQAQPARATVTMQLAASGAHRPYSVEATIPAGPDRGDAVLYVVVTQSGLRSAVKAGENRGVTLEHAHVARDWSGPISFDAKGQARTAGSIGAELAANGSLAAFVQRRSDGAVLQALGMPACPAS